MQQMEILNNPESLPGEHAEIEKFKTKYNEMINDPDFFMNFMDDAAGFSEKLREKYGFEYNQCQYAHLLAGSSLAKEIEITRVDFDGEDSICSFIEQEYVKFQQSKEKSQ